MNPQLDAIYAKYAPAQATSPSPSPSEKPPPAARHAQERSASDDSEASPSPSSLLLLTRDAVPELVKTLELPDDSTFAADMYRALEQARLRLEGAAKN